MATGDSRSDGGIRAEVGRLRCELKELELRMLDRNLHLARLWVVAITLASLALCAAILGPHLANH